MRPPRQPAGVSGPGPESWLLPFATVNLLLAAVFLLLHATAQSDLEKLRDQMRQTEKGSKPEPVAMTPVFPVVGGPVFPKPRRNIIPASTDMEGLPQPMRRTALSLVRAMKDLQSDQIRFSLDKRGMVVNIGSGILFDSGSARLHPNAMKVLDSMGGILAEIPNQVIVEGHTDEQPFPVGEPFSANWRLSTDRALAVIRYLIERDLIPQKRLALGAFAANQPIDAPGMASPLRDALNRRVDLVILGPSPVKQRTEYGFPGSADLPDPGW